VKTTWDELMRYAPEQEIPLPPLQDGEGARILNKTMGKIKETNRKPARPVRTVLIAAAVAALLCGSAFAAHSFGWFDQLFGEKAALVKDHVTSYDETTTTDITQPAYTEEEQAMIAEGTMQVPDTADLADTGVSATTENFVFTLQSMLVSKDSVLAVMRVDARTDKAAATLAALPEASDNEKEMARMLQVHVRNNIDFRGDHSLEWKLGGMGMHIIQVEGRTAYMVLTNNGGEIEPGDQLLFQAWYQDKTVDLFEIPVPDQLEQELVIELDESAYEDQYDCWQTATITPISFRLEGRYGRNCSSLKPNDAVSITLKDGTSFDLASADNGYADSDYGTYGSMNSSGIGMPEEDRTKNTWLFSQLIDLDELASITVCGVTYPILQ
jgi:hypothetical protein